MTRRRPGARGAVGAAVLAVAAGGCSPDAFVLKRGGPLPAPQGEADPSANRAGPIPRAGAPESDARTRTAAYEPGDRVDLGSSDAVLSLPPGAVLGDVELAGDMDADGYADIAVVNERYGGGTASQGQKRFAIHLVYGRSGIRGHITLEDSPVILLPSFSQRRRVALSAAGDVNGDGHADLLVAMPPQRGLCGEGRVHLVYGREDPRRGVTHLADTSAELIDGADCAGFGIRAERLGDIDGDGRGDFAIAAQSPRGEGGGSGRVYVFYGSKEKLSGRVEARARADAVIHDPELTSLGDGLSAAGNVDGDGEADVLVGGEHPEEGARIYLIRGSSTQLSGMFRPGELGVHLEARGDCPRWSATVRGIGDTDGDGPTDFAMRGCGDAVAHLFYGDADRYQDTFTLEDATTFRGPFESKVGVGGLAEAGDTNGDGMRDFLVSAPEAREERGALYLVPGVDRSRSTEIDLRTNAVAFLGRNYVAQDRGTTADNAGEHGVSGGFDVDGDGLDDFVVSGLPGSGITDSDRSRVYLVLGRARTP